MSLGLGIFLSTILLLVVWQIDKRAKWRTAGKVVAMIFGLLVLGGLGVWGYIEAAETMADRAMVAAVREGRVKSLKDVVIGSSRSEVLYRLGQPTETEDDKSLTYSETNNGVTVYFTEDIVQSISCWGQYSFECDSFAGVGIGTTEERAIEVLGAPLSSELMTDMKFLRFGKQSDWLGLVLAKGEVVQIIVGRSAPAT